MAIMRHVTVKNLQRLDPEKIWLFQCETEEMMDLLAHRLSEFEKITGKNLTGVIVGPGVTVDQLTVEQLEALLEQKRKGV